MTARILFAGALLTVAVGFAVERRSGAQASLKVTYGANGLQSLSYNGVALEDVQANPSDAFHIWHMKVTDLTGNVLHGGQYDWGENNNGRSWNSTTQTWTYPYTWGSISVQYQQQGNALLLNVTETNQSGSGVILQGASMFPLALHFPTLPAGFTDASYPQLSYNTTAPSVRPADYGSGLVVAVVPSAQKPLYSGFLPQGSPNSYTALISSTTPDGLATFQPHNDRPVLPGQTDQFTVALRFAPSGTDPSTLAADAYQSWAATWPMQVQWKDRRIIGTSYLASSPTGPVNAPAGYPNNPRRYFNDSSAADFDVTSPDGLAKFQQRILATAQTIVQNLQRLNAQGVITWDIEGEQYPQETSYVCAPDQIAAVAPEMESIVTAPSSSYAGMKLDDAYFKTIRDAGFRVGVCIRPQHFTANPDGTAAQVYLPDSQVVGEIVRKMQYAHDRWGATLFYIDSTVEQDGAVLDASLFQQAAAALPDSLLIPEESTAKFYAYTAPFLTFLFHGDLGTDNSVYNYYPKAFSANLINDVDPAKLAAAVPALTAAVQHGDVLMVHADYWQDNNTTVQKIYAAAASASGPTSTAAADSGTDAQQSQSSGATSGTNAGTTTTVTAPTSQDSSSASTSPQTSVSASPATPVTTAPASSPAAPSVAAAGGPLNITSPAAGDTLSGTVQVQAQVSLTLDAAGSYLMVDGAEIGTRRVVNGPYTYALDTTTLSDGTHTLQLWAHDIGNNASLSQTVSIRVANATASASSSQVTAAATASSVSTSSPAVAAPTGATSSVQDAAAAGTATAGGPVQLVYPGSGQAVSGLVTVLANVTAALDAAGSYLMVDGQEVGFQRVASAPYAYAIDTSTLSVGAHTLQVWAHDIGNNTILSNESVISVVR